jgi:uncharacterized membrane protein YjjP (DUF1212 family)
MDARGDLNEAFNGKYGSAKPPTLSASQGQKRRQTLQRNHEHQGSPELGGGSIKRGHYNWRTFWKGGNLLKFMRWLVAGTTADLSESDDEIRDNLQFFARILILLRDYHAEFGMPGKGGPVDQEEVIMNLTRGLAAGGTPIWALESVLQKASEGLTGNQGAEFFVLPRRALISDGAGNTRLLRITRGYNVHLLNVMEQITIRLASFASNTSGVARLPTRMPSPEEFRLAQRAGTATELNAPLNKKGMAREILDLASEHEGFFFYLNSHKKELVFEDDSKNGGDGGDAAVTGGTIKESDRFWIIEDHLGELFTRLAAIEALEAIDKINQSDQRQYSRWVATLFKFLASACASGMWFHGSWPDMLCAGVGGLILGWVSTWGILTKQERVLLEAIASWILGTFAYSITLVWPDNTCFGAIAIAGALDILQGYKMTFSVVEVLSKNAVAGSADFMEAILYTSVITTFLKLGQGTASLIFGEDGSFADSSLDCSDPVNSYWLFLLVPLGALAWTGGFNPDYNELPMMAFHGILVFGVNWALEQQGKIDSKSSLFISAMSVSLSAGLVSRFTGRQALGNTFAGLYVLVPGVYLVDNLFTGNSTDFIGEVVYNSLLIGVGAWSGTIFCAPIILGTTAGLERLGASTRSEKKDKNKAMLYF